MGLQHFFFSLPVRCSFNAQLPFKDVISDEMGTLNKFFNV